MSCFICDLRTPESHKILRTMTSYRGVPLYNLLYDFISKYFDVEVDDEDMVCTTCCALLDALDRLRCELDNVEQMLQLQITRKYKLSEANRMCRLDERTAKLFRRGVNRRFACVQCLFEVDFADCLLPHSWFHDQKIDLINNCVETWFDCSLATNDCADCTLSFGTNAILQSHLREFHADSEPIFDASDVQLNIDADSENDESINYVYEGDTTCNDTIENATTNDLLRCDKCSEEFNGRLELQQHLRSVHIVCEICNTKCRNKTTLRGHIRRLHTKHACDKCGKVLGSLGSHRAHQATHGVDLKFSCPYCQKGFRAKSLLDTHIVIHTKVCNFTCHICGQKFVHERSHRLHVQWHTNPRPHKCSICEKTYKHLSHLAVHRRSHSGELPKGCQYCDKRFASSSKLKVHMVKHTGVYSHPCQICSRGYMKRYKLAEHMFGAHGDKTMLSNKPKCEYKVMVRPELIQHQPDEN